MFEIPMGIPRPDKEPASVDDMRVAIDRASRDSSLIHCALDAARYQGKSGEDTYVILAYYGLRELERMWRMNRQWLNAHPSPRFVMPESPTQETRPSPSDSWTDQETRESGMGWPTPK